MLSPWKVCIAQPTSRLRNFETNEFGKRLQNAQQDRSKEKFETSKS